MSTRKKEEAAKSLHALYEEYQADPDFAHLRTEGINFVPGVGSLKPRIILVGEAPGRTENTRKVPFVGAAGRVLEEMLIGIDVDRRECFITNVVKYRPPNNRTPTAEETETSRDYLRDELHIVGHKKRFEGHPPVVLLGATARRCVFPGGLGPTLGVPYVTDTNWTFVTTYHPAATLYNPGLRPTLLTQFRHIRELMRSSGR